MRRIKLLVVTLFAVCAISAVTAVAASAENPTILPVPTAAEPLEYKFESPAGVLEPTTEKRSITCQKDKGTGKFTSQDAGPFGIDFEECKEPTSGAKCNTAGDAAGIILLAETETKGTLVVYGKGLLGFVATIAEKEKDVKITCGVLKINVLATVMGKVEGVTKGVKTKSAKLTFLQTKGEQELTTCETLKVFCEGKTFKLGVDFGTGSGEQLGGLESKETVTFAKEAAVDF